MEVVFYDPDEDEDGIGERAWELASESGIRILSDKDLRAVAMDGDDVVGAMFDSTVADQYSFDVVVDPSRSGSGIGGSLIDAGLDEYRSAEEAGAKLVLDVVNQSLVSALERRGLSVLDKDGDHVVMGYGSQKTSAGRRAMNADPELVPGIAFFLEGDGHWDVKEMPDWVLDVAEYSGDLTIQGYDCAVFVTPEGEQWAQKASGTPAPKGDEAAREILSSLSGVWTMKPSRVSAELRRIASGINECSKPVRPDLVERDLKKVLAAMDGPAVTLESVEYVERGGELNMPSFQVKGTIQGETFEGIASMSLDLRDTQYEPIAGVDPTAPEYGVERMDLFNLVTESDAWEEGAAGWGDYQVAP